MKIGALDSGFEYVGKKFLSKSDGVLQKVGKFCDPNGSQVSTNVFTALLLSCVLLPRLGNARDKTEKREILTRDTIAIGTMLFAMKGISGGFAKAMEKKHGLVLTNKVLDKKLNPLQKLWEFIKPNGGIKVLSTEDIASKFAGIKDEASLTKYWDYVNKNGGDSSKIIEKMFKGKNTSEIIDILKDSANNPIFKKSKLINSVLKTATLGVIFSILGVGLPKLNEFLTKKLDKKEENPRPEYKRENIFIKTSLKNHAGTFQSFMG